MEYKSKLGTIVDGIGASEHLDSSGEVLDIKGMDISSLGSSDSILNFEHNSKENPAQVCGKVTFAKKIFKKSDCDNKRQEYFWNICQKPFVYVKGELFDHPDLDHDGARNVAALLRYDNRDKGKKTRRLISFSIEGGKMDKQGMVVKKSIARDLALTIKHCNKMCIAEILDDIKERKDLYKNEGSRSSRNIIIEDMKKSLPSKDNFNKLVDNFKDTKSFKQKQDKTDEIGKLATKTITKPAEAKPKREFTPKNAPSTLEVGDRIKYDKSKKMKTGKDIYNNPDTWKSENNMRKALVAGMMGGSPDSKTGGAALASEELVGKMIDVGIKKPKEEKKKIEKNESNKQPHDIVRVHPKHFHQKVDKFRNSSDMNRANVHPYSHEDYSKMKTYMTRDGKSGYAVKNGNELVSVHSSERGRGDHLIGHAVKNGARKLDAYDIGGKLPKLYSKHGFQENSRGGFDPQYADASNKLLHTHKPDFVEMSIPDKPKLKKPEGLEKGQKGVEFSGLAGKRMDRQDVAQVNNPIAAMRVQKEIGEDDPVSSGTHGMAIKTSKKSKAFNFEPTQDRSKMKESKGRGDYPSTDQHEGLHHHINKINEKHPHLKEHTQSLIRHSLENFFHPKDRMAMTRYVKDNGYSGNINEEVLAHLEETRVNSKLREAFNSHSNLGEDGNRERQNRISNTLNPKNKKGLLPWAKSVNIDKLQEIHNNVTKKDKEKSKIPEIQRFAPGKRK